MLQAMATAIVEYRRALALLGIAIELARAGAPFAVMPPGPLWKPKPPREGDSVRGLVIRRVERFIKNSIMRLLRFTHVRSGYESRAHWCLCVGRARRSPR